MQVKNQCRIDFRYKPSQSSPSIPKTIFSNTVSTDIITHPLKIEKLVDKTTASVYSILTFTIRIYNDSLIPINNVFIKDFSPCNLISISNTFMVNSQKVRNVDIKAGYTLPFYLKPKHLVILTFKMAVKPKSSLKTLINSSLVEYDYIYNTEEKPLRICVYTDSNPIFIKNDLVKNFNIDKTLELPDYMPPLKEIVKGCVKIKISEIKLLPTPIIGKDDEISYKALIVGSIQYKILYDYSLPYPCNSKASSSTNLYYVHEFSTSITVPEGAEFFNINNSNNLKSIIKYFNCSKVTNRTLHIKTIVNLNLY